MAKGNGNGYDPRERYPEEWAQLLINIGLGQPYERACRSAGFPERTFYRIKDTGSKAATGKFHELWQELKKAEAVGETARLKIINAGAKGWQSAAWVQERRYRKDLGRYDKVQAEVEHSGVVLNIVPSDRKHARAETGEDDSGECA